MVEIYQDDHDKDHDKRDHLHEIWFALWPFW